MAAHFSSDSIHYHLYFLFAFLPLTSALRWQDLYAQDGFALPTVSVGKSICNFENNMFYSCRNRLIHGRSQHNFDNSRVHSPAVKSKYIFFFRISQVRATSSIRIYWHWFKIDSYSHQKRARNFLRVFTDVPVIDATFRRLIPFRSNEIPFAYCSLYTDSDFL